MVQEPYSETLHYRPTKGVWLCNRAESTRRTNRGESTNVRHLRDLRKHSRMEISGDFRMMKLKDDAAGHARSLLPDDLVH